MLAGGVQYPIAEGRLHPAALLTIPGSEAVPTETEASLRAELSDHIAGAQGEIEAHLSSILRTGDGAAIATAENQLKSLSRLQQRVAASHGSGLVSIRAEVAAFVAAAQVIANQAVASAATAQTADAALHLASEAARREVTSFVEDFYEKKIFDPFLRFASAEEEAAYRKGEEERQREIKAALGLGTSEGDLRAADLSIAQMEDAGAHGADRSPNYEPRLRGLKAARSDLAARMGQPEKEQKAQTAPAASRDGGDPGLAFDPEMIACLRASGVVPADQDQQGHGITREAAPTASRGRV